MEFSEIRCAHINFYIVENSQLTRGHRGITGGDCRGRLMMVMALMMLMLMLKGIMFKSNQDDQCSLIMVIRSSNERGSESFPQLLSRSFTDQGPSMPLLLKFIIIDIKLWFDTIIISHRMMISYMAGSRCLYARMKARGHQKPYKFIGILIIIFKHLMNS